MCGGAGGRCDDDHLRAVVLREHAEGDRDVSDEGVEDPLLALGGARRQVLVDPQPAEQAAAGAQRTDDADEVGIVRVLLKRPSQVRHRARDHISPVGPEALCRLLVEEGELEQVHRLLLSAGPLQHGRIQKASRPVDGYEVERPAAQVGRHVEGVQEPAGRLGHRTALRDPSGSGGARLLDGRRDGSLLRHGTGVGIGRVEQKAEASAVGRAQREHVAEKILQ